MRAKAENLEMLQAGAGMIQTGTAQLTASNAGALIANGNITMDQSASRVMVVNGEVTLDQSGAVLLVANQVHTGSSSGTVFLIARKVDGNVNTAFGPRESVLFGAVAGLVMGVIMMIGGLFRRKGKK